MMPSGEVFTCDLSGRFRLEGRSTKERYPLCTGDEVLMEVRPGGAKEGMVWERLPRRNVMRRAHPKDAERWQVLVANIDQILVLSCLKNPRLSPRFIDECLVAAECAKIPVCLLFNKQDLLDDKDRGAQKVWCAIYEQAGYSCLLTSLQNKKSELDPAVYKCLQDKTTFILGNSGVGKSTLINRLIPQAAQVTRDIVRFTKKGAHTTTHTTIFPLPQAGGFLIDSPGMKRLQCALDNPPAMHFPELRKQAKNCLFADCKHKKEPHCAVREKVERNEVSKYRYKSYLQHLERYEAAQNRAPSR